MEVTQMNEKFRLIDPDLLKLANADKSIVDRQKAYDNADKLEVHKQIGFLKRLMADRQEANTFKKDPVRYIERNDVVISPRVMHLITNAVLFEVAIPPETLKLLDKRALEDLIDMRACMMAAPDQAASALADAAVAVAVAIVIAVAISL